MNDKVKKAKAKAVKEKAESVQADKDLVKAKQAAQTYIALKNLATSQGQVKKGESFTCNARELAIFKRVKAI